MGNFWSRHTPSNQNEYRVYVGNGLYVTYTSSDLQNHFFPADPHKRKRPRCNQGTLQAMGKLGRIRDVPYFREIKQNDKLFYYRPLVSDFTITWAPYIVEEKIWKTISRKAQSRLLMPRKFSISSTLIRPNRILEFVEHIWKYLDMNIKIPFRRPSRSMDLYISFSRGDGINLYEKLRDIPPTMYYVRLGSLSWGGIREMEIRCPDVREGEISPHLAELSGTSSMRLRQKLDKKWYLIPESPSHSAPNGDEAARDVLIGPRELHLALIWFWKALVWNSMHEGHMFLFRTRKNSLRVREEHALNYIVCDKHEVELNDETAIGFWRVLHSSAVPRAIARGPSSAAPRATSRERSIATQSAIDGKLSMGQRNSQIAQGISGTLMAPSDPEALGGSQAPPQIPHTSQVLQATSTDTREPSCEVRNATAKGDSNRVKRVLVRQSQGATPEVGGGERAQRPTRTNLRSILGALRTPGLVAAAVAGVVAAKGQFGQGSGRPPPFLDALRNQGRGGLAKHGAPPAPAATGRGTPRNRGASPAPAATQRGGMAGKGRRGKGRKKSNTGRPPPSPHPSPHPAQ